MSEDSLRNALKSIIAMGGVDLEAKVSYSTFHSVCRHHGVGRLDYDMAEQAARNAMREREADGCMIWEIGIDEFVEEYLKLKGVSNDAA